MGYLKIEGCYSDNNGNSVKAPEGLVEVFVAFAGGGNTLIIDEKSKLKKN